MTSAEVSQDRQIPAPEAEVYKPFVALAMSSVAKWCIIPIQDYLGLDNSCRTNTPSTLGCNWRWRAKKEQLSEELQKEILVQTMRYGRMNWKNYKKTNEFGG